VIVRKVSILIALVILALALLLLDSMFGDALPLQIKFLMALVYIAPVVLMVNRKMLTSESSPVVISMLALCGLYLSSAVLTGSGFKHSVYILICVAWYYAGLLLARSAVGRSYLALFSSAFTLTLFFLYIGGVVSAPKNTVGSGMLYLTIFSVLLFYLDGREKLHIIAYTILIGIFMIFLDMRGGVAQILILLSGLLLSVRFQWLSKVYGLWFGTFIVFLIMLVLFISYSNDFELFGQVEALVSDQTGRSLHSGRQLIWPIALEEISNKPVFGNGAGFLINSLPGSETWSAHNAYLQVSMQVGLIGLSLLLYALYITLKNMQVKANAEVSFVFMVIWLMIVVYNCLEVSLIQNAMPIVVVQWLIFGLLNGVAISKNGKVN